MTNPADDADFRGRIQKLEGLLQQLETVADPATRSIALEAVQTLMEFHGAAVSKIVQIVAEAGNTGAALLATLSRNDLVSSLLLLYGLHPADFETRVKDALERARPKVKSHGGSIELLGITENTVKIRVEKSGHGCQSTAGKIKSAIEEAIFDKAPEVTSIEIEGLSPPQTSSGFVPLEQLLGSHNGRSPIQKGDSHDSQRPAPSHAYSGHE